MHNFSDHCMKWTFHLKYTFKQTINNENENVTKAINKVYGFYSVLNRLCDHWPMTLLNILIS